MWHPSGPSPSIWSWQPLLANAKEERILIGPDSASAPPYIWHCGWGRIKPSVPTATAFHFFCCDRWLDIIKQYIIKRYKRKKKIYISQRFSSLLSPLSLLRDSTIWLAGLVVVDMKNNLVVKKNPTDYIKNNQNWTKKNNQEQAGETCTPVHGSSLVCGSMNCLEPKNRQLLQ